MERNEDSSAEPLVRGLLSMAGLAPPPEDFAVIVDRFEGIRQMVSLLYTMPGVRYAEPAVRFEPRVADAL